MANLLSPGVSVNEVNLTTVVPSVLTTAGAYAGPFAWGPAATVIPVSSETILLNTFGKPDSNTYASFFTAASFLAYGNNLQVVRAANTASYNSSANANAQVQITNSNVFQYNYLPSGASNALGAFVARYPGALGNSLTVSVIDAGATANQYANWSVPLYNSANTNYANTSLSGYFNSQPSTSYTGTQLGAANDQIHIAVVDTGGLFSGTKGTVLETFAFLSKASDSVDVNGQSNYYKNAIFNNSKYVYAVDPVNYGSTNATWGKATANTSFATLSGAYTLPLAAGTDATITDSDIINAQNLLADPAQASISLLMTGPYTSLAVQTNAINIQLHAVMQLRLFLHHNQQLLITLVVKELVS